MVSHGSVLWYDVPAREFPVKRWLRQRYPFNVSPASVARLDALAAPAAPASGRHFPALVWLTDHQRS
ncbi:MAG TPA: hypothetical protein VFU69_00515 [Ktedonobacterales bacterium]|nr:hypothetical protein [Ktedonobacterales bacterium]